MKTLLFPFYRERKCEMLMIFANAWGECLWAK